LKRELELLRKEHEFLPPMCLLNRVKIPVKHRGPRLAAAPAPAAGRSTSR
jgi:hypothetical protein